MRINPFLTRRTKKPKQACKSDPQRHLVYWMERKIAGWAIYQHADVEDLQRIADYVCRRYKVKRVSVVIENKGDQRVFGWHVDNGIHLNADFHGDNTAVLVHELAHYIADQVLPSDESHGKEFVTIYGELLDMLNLFPLKLFFIMCDDHGVSYV